MVRGFQGLQGPPGPSVPIPTSHTAYVSETGNDLTGQLGDRAKPFQTLDAAIKAGDSLSHLTVIVAAGTYTLSYLPVGRVLPPPAVLSDLLESGNSYTKHIVIVGAYIYSTTILTNGLTFSGLLITFNNVYLRSVNQPVLSAINSLLLLNSCYIQSTYNESSSGGLNYIVYATNTLVSVSRGSFSLISTPGNPTNIIVCYSDVGLNLHYCRFYHYAYAQTSVNIPTTLTLVGGRGSIITFFTEAYLGEPGNDEYSIVSVVYLDGPTKLTMQDCAITTSNVGSLIPAGQLFQFFDPTSTLDPSNDLVVNNFSLNGVSKFVKVSTELPPGGSYQNIAWDIEAIPTGGFYVNRHGLIGANGIALTTNMVSGSYTISSNDYLVYSTGTEVILGDTRSSGVPIVEGRVVVIVNGGTGPLAVTGHLAFSSPVLEPTTSATFQYLSKVGWVKTS